MYHILEPDTEVRAERVDPKQSPPMFLTSSPDVVRRLLQILMSLTKPVAVQPEIGLVRAAEVEFNYGLGRFSLF